MMRLSKEIPTVNKAIACKIKVNLAWGITHAYSKSE